MPTGYTSAVEDGTITTLAEYAMTCARAFGALVSLRDAPLDAPVPDVIEPSQYHADQAREAEARLAALRAVAAEECEAGAEAAYQQSLRYREEQITRAATQRARYEAMVAKVEAWTPPTSDHVGLRDFMLSQIQESVRSGGYLPPVPERKSGETWRNEAIAAAERNIAYHREKQEEENARAAERTAWLRALRESLAESP